MVPAQSRADGPLAQMDQVLHEGGLLQIGTPGQKAEGWRRVIVELGRIGNDVAEIFVQERIVRFDPEFELVTATHRGDGALEVSLAEKIVLNDFDGRGVVVGIEIVGVVAHHPVQIHHHIGRKNMLIADDAHGLDVVGGLALRAQRRRRVKGENVVRCLLHKFVRQLVARKFVAHDQAEPIVGRQLPLVMQRKIAQRAGVGKILRHHWVQVVVGHAPAGAGAQRVFPPDILALGERAGGAKAPTRQHDLPVKALGRILQRIHFHDAAHLAAVFRGNSGGVNADRLHVIRFDLRTKTGRTVIGERNTVDHELCLVFGATRMQHGVAFVQPAGLRIHHILDGASGDGTEPVLNRVGANLADRAGLIGIDQGVGCDDRDGLIHRRQLELNHQFGGNRGTNLDGLRHRRKSRGADFQTVDAVGQALHIEDTLIAAAERISILVGVAAERDGDLHAETGRIGDL